jgi:hypothetical protein
MAASSSRPKSRSSTATTKDLKGLEQALLAGASVAKRATEAIEKQVSEMKWYSVSMALARQPVQPREAWTQMLSVEGVIQGKKPWLSRGETRLTADIAYVDYAIPKNSKILQIRDKSKIPDQIIANALLAYGQTARSLHHKPIGVIVDERPKSYDVKVYFLLSVSQYDEP